MLLTADIARTLRPATPVEQITDLIEKAVKNSARAGGTKIDITGLIPAQHTTKWMTGALTDFAGELKSALTEAGYTITTQEPTAHRRGFINLAWAG